MMGVGALVFLIGLALTLTGGDDPDDSAAATTTNAPVELTTTSSATVTTTTTPSTSSTTTTTLATTTTTTTTTIPKEPVEEFVEAFSTALAAGDREFVLERLHPQVYANWGEDLCEAWVEREIMELSDYTLVRINSGPLAASVATPNGQITVPDVFETDVSFTFQGEGFESGGTFALIDTTMYWLGQCR
jgi:hypothetical protein